MLRYKESREIWSAFADKTGESILENMPLVLRCARYIKSNCGYEEAKTFLALIRLATIIATIIGD